MAGDDLEFRIVANDDASTVVDKVQKQVDKLDGTSAEVDIKADDGNAETAIRDLAARLEGLTARQQEIVLKAEVAKAEADVKRIERGLQGVRDMSDEQVQIRLTALDNATADLEAARTLRDQLSARNAEVTIEADDRASGDLQRVSDEARQLDGQKVDIDVSASGLDGILGKLGELDGNVGKLAGGLGSLSAGGSIAAGAGVIAAALGAAAVSAADAAISADSLATLTGDTVEDASRLQQVWKLSGADVQDLADVALQVQGALAQTPELAQQLGIDLRDGATGGQRLSQVLEKVRDFSGSAADKAQLMSAVFGEEGARQAATLLSIVEDIPKALEDVDADLVISDEQVRNAREFKGQVAQLSAQFQGFAAEIGSSVVPALADALGLLNDIAGIEIGGQGILDISGYNAFKSVIEDEPIFVDLDLTKFPEFQDELAAAQEGMSETEYSAEQVAGAFDVIEEAVSSAEQAVSSYNETQRKAVDSQYAARSAGDDLAETILGYAEKVKEAEGNSIELNRITDDLRNKTIAYADAQVQAAKDVGERMGVTLNAADADRIWREHMVQSTQFMTGEQRGAILQYIADVEGIEPTKVTQIEALIAQGKLDEAVRILNSTVDGPWNAEVIPSVDPNSLGKTESQLEILARNRTMTIDIITKGGAGYGTATGGPRAAGGGVSPGSMHPFAESGPETVTDAFGNTWLFVPRNMSVRPVDTSTSTTRTPAGNVTNVYNLPPGLSPREITRANRNARRRGFGRAS